MIVALEGWSFGITSNGILMAEKNLCPDPKVWGRLKYFRILTDLCDDHMSPFTVGNLDGIMSALSLVSVPGKNQKQKLVFCWDRKQPAGHCEQLRLLRCNRLEDSHSGCEKTSGR